MGKLKDAIAIIGYLILTILIIIVSYQIIKTIIGGTWEFQDIVIPLLIIIISGLFGIFLKLGILDERTKHIGNSLRRLGNDFKEHVSKYHQ